MLYALNLVPATDWDAKQLSQRPEARTPSPLEAPPTSPHLSCVKVLTPEHTTSAFLPQAKPSHCMHSAWCPPHLNFVMVSHSCHIHTGLPQARPSPCTRSTSSPPLSWTQSSCRSVPRRAPRRLWRRRWRRSARSLTTLGCRPEVGGWMRLQGGSWGVTHNCQCDWQAAARLRAEEKGYGSVGRGAEGHFWRSISASSGRWVGSGRRQSGRGETSKVVRLRQQRGKWVNGWAALPN